MIMIERYIIPKIGCMRISEGDNKTYFVTFKPINEDKKEFQIETDTEKRVVTKCGECYLRGKYEEELRLILGKDSNKLLDGTWLEQYKDHYDWE